MKNEKQVRVIAGFSDIRGFQNFLDRVAHPQTEFVPFWKAYRAMVDRFERETGYFIKRIGDGVFFAKEVQPMRESVDSVDVLKRAWIFTNRITQLIEAKKTPRPDGFRTRLVCDYAWKMPCKQFNYDYIGKRINMCEKLTHCYESNLVVAHDSVVELLTPIQNANHHFVFTKIEGACDRINDQDRKALWDFKIKSSIKDKG